MRTRLCLNDVGKTFTMHLQGGLAIPVVAGVSFAVDAGECVVLGGPSGAGKSSILKMIYGNYRCERGQILVTEDEKIVNIASAAPRQVLALRQKTIGYVSQFLRVIPRVSAENVVAEPLIAQGTGEAAARKVARDLLARLNVPESLWGLPPATFSGGEQQRVNIARGFIAHYPLLLLDEPTASLDAANRAVVIDLVNEKKQQGVAMLGILHDLDVREVIADRVVDVSGFSARAA
ncbi:phosphonate C-P lyase system protein PhnL [Pannonibacter tanglangensis]|uniref:Phosphonate C-P lyase system protein PhnL n=1 Tax=Pannonibacter tanglangensis TaxID=2750084 RepID=A0ABW9ZTG1_9HYPH|nr:phosphonate C-P lyase system protein PhnL [Pannonibacter sp. XCT-34]NBN65985.1 phosphonate C-P lyase system protein PhnL [Pannonibacter sp. XCT-34]